MDSDFSLDSHANFLMDGDSVKYLNADSPIKEDDMENFDSKVWKRNANQLVIFTPTL